MAQQHQGSGDNVAGNKTTNIILKRGLLVVVFLGVIMLLGMNKIIGCINPDEIPVPKAVIISPLTALVGEPVTFHADQTENSYSGVSDLTELYNYEWIYTDGQVFMGYSSTMTFFNPGEFYVKLRVSSKEDPTIFSEAVKKIFITSDLGEHDDTTDQDQDNNAVSRLTCPSCNGEGALLCPSCRGIGQILNPVSGSYDICSVCNASGKVKCATCFGRGMVTSAPN